MNKTKNTALCAGLLALAGCISGCMTTKTPVVTPGVNGGPPTTNIVVTVNQANLAMDCAGIQAATTIAVSEVASNQQAVAILTDFNLVLSGIINGANSNSVPQVMALLGKNGNAAIQQEITPLVAAASQLEQQLLNKYGATVSGQITIAIAKAVSNGIAVGLAVPAVKPTTQIWSPIPLDDYARDQDRGVVRIHLLEE